MYYNLTTETFTKELPKVIETDYLQVTTCKHINKPTIMYVTLGDDEPLCLHNEDNSDELAIPFFLNGDKKFKEYLDFFKEDLDN